MPVQSLHLKYIQLFINNQYVNSANGKTYATMISSTDELICDVQEAAKVDVYKAVLAAKQAFKPNSVWRKMSASIRGRLLNKLSDLIERDIDCVAGLEQLTNGVDISTAYKRVELAVQYLRYIALMADKIYGKAIPIVGPYFAFTRLEPIGVCGTLIENDLPLVMITIQIGVALSAGNTIVIKAAEQTPLTALYLGSVISEAGFPPGVVNIIAGFNKTIGTALSEHKDIKNVALFGSKYALNHNKTITDSRVMIEMLPMVGFRDELKDFTFNKENEKLDKCVKWSIELATKRVVSYPYNASNQKPFQIDNKHFSKIVSYILLYTKKCILL